ncbi:MAG: alpha/beta hydrolase, partial [Gammaproteobacteria bacterium]|nr:alpha/beta hydrolase [Gammaproteobacteria bacterium]
SMALLLMFLIFSTTISADTISQVMDSKLVGLADYRPGDADKPALLILHGFLQTHNFGIIKSLTDELADNGYTVLAPTLTLGIDKRARSFTCDMIQSHKFDDQYAELDSWINWLKNNGHSEIILIGHSTGGLGVLAYSALRNTLSVSIMGLIVINPTILVTKSERDKINKNLVVARELLAKNKNELGEFTLAYCVDNYISSPGSYISYASITENDLFSYFSNANHPVINIVASDDKLIPENMGNKLRKKGGNVIDIDGANHFFTNGHEFELFDAVNKAILILNKKQSDV